MTAEDVPYLGSTWECIRLPDHTFPQEGALRLLAAPLRTGGQLMAVVNAEENLAVEPEDPAVARGRWMFSYSEPPASDVALLLSGIRLVTSDRGGCIRLPSDILNAVDVEPGGNPRIVLWGESVMLALDERDVARLDPQVPFDGPGNWDWTGGLDEEDLYQATDLRHSVIAFPPGDNYAPDAVTLITRQVELLEHAVFRILDQLEIDLVLQREVVDALALIRNELRRPEPWRACIRLAAGFAIGVLSSVLGSALWEALRDPAESLLRAVK